MLILNCFKSEVCQEANGAQTTKLNENIEEKVDDYDPHDYGKENQPTLFWGSVFHLIKTIVGSGLLTVPFIFQMVGYGVGIIGTLSIAILYIHVIHILLEVEYELCKKLKTPNLTYVGIVKNAFKEGPECIRKYSFLVQFLVFYRYTVNKCLINAIYLIIISNNFKIIIDHYLNTDMSSIKVMTIVIVPLTFTALIRQLKFLVPFSMLTNAFNIVNVFLILLISTNHKRTTEFSVVNDIYKFPYFFSIMLGAVSGTSIVIPLKNDMKNPKRFSSLFGVLNISVVLCAILYTVFGVIGSLKYGEDTQPNILQNLPPGEFLTQLVLILYSIAIGVSYTLFFYIIFDTIWTNLLKDIIAKLKYGTFLEYSLRIGINIIPYVIVLLVPNFRILVSVFGVLMILADKGIPPFLQLLLLMNSENKTTMVYIKILKNIGLTLLFLFMFVASSREVIRYIIIYYSK